MALPVAPDHSYNVDVPKNTNDLHQLLFGGEDEIHSFAHEHFSIAAESKKDDFDGAGSIDTNLDHVSDMDIALKHSRLYEGHSLNTTVTAPGAVMALGLIYLKSNNLVIAKSLAPPSTLYLLSQERPDLLCLKCISTQLGNFDAFTHSLIDLFTY